MWRYMALGGSALAAVAAGVLLVGRPDAPAEALPPAPAAQPQDAVEPLPEEVPEAAPKTREQKRFGRYDKDKDGAITRDEYLQSRRKAYAKLDANRDGVLSFDEWATKTTAKFATADRDKSGAMSAAEFATTAVKRKPAKRAAPCPPTRTQEEEG